MEKILLLISKSSRNVEKEMDYRYLQNLTNIKFISSTLVVPFVINEIKFLDLSKGICLKTMEPGEIFCMREKNLTNPSCIPLNDGDKKEAPVA